MKINQPSFKRNSTRHFGLHGFTLIEAMFAVAIACTLFLGIYTFFIQSIRGVTQDEQLIESLDTLQNLTERVRRDIYGIRPFNYPTNSPLPIDVIGEKEGFKGKRRLYRNLVYHDGPGYTRVEELEPTVINVDYGYNPDTNSYTTVANDSMDNFFVNATVYEGGEQLGAMQRASTFYENVTASLEQQKHTETDPEPESAKVHDYFFFSGGNRIHYRYYMEDRKGNPINYVTRREYDLSGELLEHKTYGKLAGKETGEVTKFVVQSTYVNRCIYRPSQDEWHGFDAVNYHIHVEVTGDKPPHTVRDLHFFVKDPWLLRNFTAQTNFERDEVKLVF